MTLLWWGAHPPHSQSRTGRLFLRHRCCCHRRGFVNHQGWMGIRPEQHAFHTERSSEANSAGLPGFGICLFIFLFLLIRFLSVCFLDPETHRESYIQQVCSRGSIFWDKSSANLIRTGCSKILSLKKKKSKLSMNLSSFQSTTMKNGLNLPLNLIMNKIHIYNSWRMSFQQSKTSLFPLSPPPLFRRAIISHGAVMRCKNKAGWQNDSMCINGKHIWQPHLVLITAACGVDMHSVFIM